MQGREAWLLLPAWQTRPGLRQASWDGSISCFITSNGRAAGHFRLSGRAFARQSVQWRCQEHTQNSSPKCPSAPSCSVRGHPTGRAHCKPDQRTDNTFFCQFWLVVFIFLLVGLTSWRSITWLYQMWSWHKLGVECYSVGMGCTLETVFMRI